jgi:hypothetical protein
MSRSSFGAGLQVRIAVGRAEGLQYFESLMPRLPDADAIGRLEVQPLPRHDVEGFVPE